MASPWHSTGLSFPRGVGWQLQGVETFGGHWFKRLGGVIWKHACCMLLVMMMCSSKQINGIAITKAQPFVVCVFHVVFLWPLKVEQDVSWCFWISKESKDQRKRPWNSNHGTSGGCGKLLGIVPNMDLMDASAKKTLSSNQIALFPLGFGTSVKSQYIYIKPAEVDTMDTVSMVHACPCYPAIPTQFSSRCQNDTMSTWDPREYMRTPGS